MTAQVFRLFARSAVIAVLLAIALGLAACGRKSGLDAPPSAAIDRPAATGTNNQEAGGAQSGFTPEGRPVAAPGAKKSLPIDVLLN